MIKYLYKWYVALCNSPTFTTWASFLSTALYGFILLPIVSTQLTIEEINVWFLLNIFVNLQMLGDFGFGSTFSRAISHAYGGANEIIIHKNVKAEDKSKSSEPNWFLIQRIFGTTSILYFLLSISLIIITGIIGYFALQIPINNLLNKNDGWISFVIILIGIFIKFNGNKYQLFLQGINKVALLQRNRAVITTLTVIVASIIVLQTKSLIALILIQQIGQIILVFRLKVLSTKYYRANIELSDYENIFDIKLIKSIFPIAWRSWVGILMSYGLIQASGIIIAQYGNPIQSSSYLFSIKIMNLIRNIANAPFYSKIPYMNQLFIRKDRESLLKLAFQRINISLTIQTLLIGIIGVSGNYILILIGSNVNLVDINIWTILMLSYFLERYGALHIQLLSLSNNIIWHIANSITGILFIIFSYILLNLVNDPILAFSVAILASTICFYTWYSSYKSYTFYKMDFFKTEYKTTLVSVIIILFVIIFTFIK
ncbi:MAG: hypothetical protein GWP19_04685 [Planctomycetia bacterium]|nr:hypothetical protein [Planctomycetia bacterium]